MASGRPPTVGEGRRLIRRFAVLSLLVIGATTAALSYVIASSLQRDMLAREWNVTGNYIRLEARQQLTPADFADPTSDRARAHFRSFHQELLRAPEAIRVKLYDRTRTILWSDEPRLIGQRFDDNPELQKALGGETVAHLETTKTKTENIFEAPERFVELYVPVGFASDDNVAGVVEVYKAPEAVFASIDRVRRVVVGTSLAGGALLWASLFGIVRSAAHRIEGQHGALEQQSRKLGAANDELRTVHVQLVAAERMAAVGEAVAAIAHGIRNPLANVRASAQVALLDCRAGAPAAVASITNAIAEVDRLAARVSDLLRFVHTSDRRGERLDLNDVVAEVLRVMKERLAAGDVRVVERLSPVLPMVLADGALLEEAIGALVENALDAMNGAGTLILITGTVTDESGAIRAFVDVDDTGPGISPPSVGKMFDLFYTTKPRGTGLGLPLARKFVEGYGGTLVAITAPGPGARFRVTLPALRT